MKRLLLSLNALIISLLSVGILATVPAYASTSRQDACGGLTLLDNSNDCNSGGSGIKDLAAGIVTILSIITGIAGVIMVIVAGFKYITSGGDSNAISSAKTTLIYAIVGLAVAALAQFLVHFVINKFGS